MSLNNVKIFIEKHNVGIIRICLLLIFFVYPFVKLIPLAAIQIMKIELMVSPLGYPTNGEDWEIQVWGTNNSLDYFIMPNCLVEINSTIGKSYFLYSNEEGKCSFTYHDTLGDITIRAIHNKLIWCLWRPQIRFVQNHVAYLVLGFYGLGTPSFIWEAINKYKNMQNKLSITLSKLMTFFITLGWILSFYWIIKWKLGSSWGYGNRILSFYIDISFDPHLMYITYINILMIFIYPILDQKINRKYNKKIDNFI